MSTAKIILALVIAFLMFKIAGVAEVYWRAHRYSVCVAEENKSHDGVTSEYLNQASARLGIPPARLSKMFDEDHKRLLRRCEEQSYTRFISLF